MEIKKMADLEKQKQFIHLRATGKSYQKISEELGVSKHTLIKWGKELSFEITHLSITLFDTKSSYLVGSNLSISA